MTNLVIRDLSIRGWRDGAPEPGWAVERDGLDDWETYATRELAIEGAFPTYAWPGGYPVEYTFEGAGAAFCGGCAAAMFRDDGTVCDGYVADEAESDIVCDVCGELIFAQNLCPDHGVRGWRDGEDDGPGFCDVCEPERRPDCAGGCDRLADHGDVYCVECRERRRRDASMSRQLHEQANVAAALGLERFVGVNGRAYDRLPYGWVAADMEHGSC